MGGKELRHGDLEPLRRTLHREKGGVGEGPWENQDSCGSEKRTY